MNPRNPFQKAQTWYEFGPQIDNVNNENRTYADVVFNMNDIEALVRYVDDEKKIDNTCTLIKFKSGNSFVVNLNFDYLVDRLDKFYNQKICFN